MKNIDFLPESYRQRAVSRRARAWWGGFTAIFVAIMALASGGQWWMYRQLGQQLAEIEPASASAHDQDAQYATLRREVSEMEESAVLFAYLQHPWPRTQIVAALVQDVPEQVQLNHFHIRVESLQPTEETIAPRKRNSAKQEAEKKLPPRLQDLESLRKEYDQAVTMVDVRGTTTDDSQLHEYIQTLAKHPLLREAQLVSLTASESAQGVRSSQFIVRARVAPGLGQEGGTPNESNGKPTESKPKQVTFSNPLGGFMTSRGDGSSWKRTSQIASRIESNEERKQ